uniref:Uncharacterized protein n=1 Tax=Opuntia streptacantha TaxID=393608 RepID=A0A7C9DYJ4_OPUST
MTTSRRLGVTVAIKNKNMKQIILPRYKISVTVISVQYISKHGNMHLTITFPSTERQMKILISSFSSSFFRHHQTSSLVSFREVAACSANVDVWQPADRTGKLDD